MLLHGEPLPPSLTLCFRLLPYPLCFADTHILKKFKIQTSRALVSTLVNYFHEPSTDDVALLSTSAHV
jgi:hypothetical protein